MKKVCCFILILSMCFGPCFTQEKNYKANAAAASSSDAVAFSMVAWSIGLTLGIAAVFLLLKSSEGDTAH